MLKGILNERAKDESKGKRLTQRTLRGHRGHGEEKDNAETQRTRRSAEMEG
jgi:hypothetical protein